MTVQTFYVETSCWGSLPRGQPQDRKRAVKRLLQLLDGRQGLWVLSSAVFGEIAAAPSAKVQAIQEQINAMGALVILPDTEAARALAHAYIDAGVLSEGRMQDAIHIALATYYGCDYLVSWNHRHMTRPKKQREYQAVNLLKGYLEMPLICNPLEACDELRSR